MAVAAVPFIAVTDQAWFDYLSTLAAGAPLDEVNFWSPQATRPMKAMAPGTPVFFRLKAPINRIAGYGFFAHFLVLGLDEAWSMFREKNGDPDALSFLSRMGRYRRLDLLDPHVERAPLGCTILRVARFWPRERWMEWGPAKGWKANIVQGKTETDEIRASRLRAELEYDAVVAPEEFAPRFELVDADERRLVLAKSVRRDGQGTFRSRLLSAYGSRCAITGEHTVPVLDAAHIQDYLGPRSNHLQNGLLLTKEFHALFDEGLVTVTPERVVRVSPRIRERWRNGHRYYPFDGRKLREPEWKEALPSPEALAWHNHRKFGLAS
jgi:putative restriction endonuclease